MEHMIYDSRGKKTVYCPFNSRQVRVWDTCRPCPHFKKIKDIGTAGFEYGMDIDGFVECNK